MNSDARTSGRSIDAPSAAPIIAYLVGFVVAGAASTGCVEPRMRTAVSAPRADRLTRSPHSTGPGRRGRGAPPCPAQSGTTGGRWTTGSRPSVSTCAAISSRGRDPQAVDRAGTLDQPLQGGGARRPAGDERVVRQHEQPALLDQRLELERPAGEDVGRAGDHARAGDPGQVVVRLPVVERPVAGQLDQGRRAGLGARREDGTDGRRPSARESYAKPCVPSSAGVSYVSSQFGPR